MPLPLIQIQIQIESLHTRLDEIDEMTNTGGICRAGSMARAVRAPVGRTKKKRIMIIAQRKRTDSLAKEPTPRKWTPLDKFSVPACLSP